MKRYILAILACCVWILAGCGGTGRIEDRYTLGTAYVSFSGYTLALELPYELRAPENDAELTYSAQRQLTRFGSNAHFLTLVEADLATHRSLAAQLEQTRSMYRDKAFREVRIEERQTKLAEDEATRFDIEYTQTMQGNKKVSLTSIVWVWEHDGTVWRVLYQYPTDDQDGKELAARLAGKVSWK